ncbi:hypothetical protein Ahy_B08g091671 [Arachis hypogaea]|uniref:Glutathione S-transferase n=1 Tax=Arachis hypogaea TaxID=3818 RepID=A0A444Y2H1_ARAHY|nr:hypothetical protein Ahy_B08g091671 [Arachis hypogaea]
MADEVVLLDTWVSMFGMRVRIALAEKGVKYDYKEQDLKNKSPLLLEMNPIHKKIPVLIHNGRPICESSIIVQYIDEIYETWKKMWLSEGEEHEAGKKELISIFKQLEDALGDKIFYGGDSFGFLDIGLIPFSCWFYTFETYGNFKMEAECPKLMAWVKRSFQRKAVSNTLPDDKKVYDFVLAMEKILKNK